MPKIVLDALIVRLEDEFNNRGEIGLELVARGGNVQVFNMTRNQAEALRDELVGVLGRNSDIGPPTPIAGAWTGWPVNLTEALTTDEGIVLPKGWRGHCVADPGDEYIDVRFRMSNGPDITFKELDRSAFRVWGVS